MSYEEKIMVAAGAASHEDEVKLETKHRTTVQIPSAVLGTCTTAAATAAKVVTLTDITDFELTKGTVIVVKFTNTNTANNPTLNVNGTGAKSIYYNTSVLSTGALGAAGTANRYIEYMYDGTNWVWISQGIDNNTTYSAMSKSELTTGTATTSRVVRADYLKSAILDIANPIGTIIHSTTCNTMAKVVAAYGGTTWIQHTGYMLRGASSDVHANHTGNDGGADSVTVSSVANHNHNQNAHSHRSVTDQYARAMSTTVSGASGLAAQGSYAYWRNTTLYNTYTESKTATNIANGSNYTVNTLPKYKNVYIWERTA